MSKTFYSYISRFQKYSQPNIQIVDDNGTLITDWKKIADKFGLYFSSAFIPNNDILPHCGPSIITSPDDGLKITSSMVNNVIKSLKNLTSIWSEGFSNNFVKVLHVI